MQRLISMEYSDDAQVDVVQKIVVRMDLNMRKGKLAAQVAHASNAPIMYQLQQSVIIMNGPTDFVYYFHDGVFNEYMETYHAINKLIKDWENGGSTKIVLGCNSEAELRDLITRGKELNIPTFPITDLGRTEFHGEKTLTCCGFGPYYRKEIDKITSNLRLI